MTEAERLYDTLESIRQYGLDTLSGPADGQDDRTWHRRGVVEMVRRAQTALQEAGKL